MPISAQVNNQLPGGNQLLKSFFELLAKSYRETPSQMSSPVVTPQGDSQLLNVLGLNADMGMFSPSPQLSDAVNWEEITGVQPTPPQPTPQLPFPPGISPALKNLPPAAISSPVTIPEAAKGAAEATGRKTKEPEGGSSYLKDFLKKMGIPLVSTGIGLGVKGALPGAAGFSKGYTEEMARREGEEGTRDFILVDPETGDTKTIQVPKDAFVQQEKAKGGGGFLGGISLDEQGNLVLPEAKTTAQIKEEIVDKEKLRTFKSVEEVEAANLPKGTIILINGRKAVIE